MSRKFLKLVIILLLLNSCSSAAKNRAMCNKLVENVKTKNYQESLNIVKSKDFYSDKQSALLKDLENGTVHYLRGEYYQSLRYFESAKKLSDDLYTISIEKKLAGSWDSNLDNYYGEKYERSLIRFYLSLVNYNLYKQGYYESFTNDAGVIVPQETLLDEKRNFHLNYSKSIIIEWDSLLQSYKNESLGNAVYKNDMLAKIWGAFIHSEFDNSNDRQITLNLYRSVDELLLRNYNIYQSFNAKNKLFRKDFDKLPNKSLQELRKDYIEETKFAKDLKQFVNRNTKNLQGDRKDNVVFLLKDNLISPKEAKTYEIPFPITSFGPQGSPIVEFAKLAMLTRDGMPYIVIEFPEIKNLDKINSYKAIIYDKNNNEVAETNLTMIQPLSDIAQLELEDQIVLIRTKIIARITAKYVAAIAAAYALYQQGGSAAQLAAMLSFKAVSIGINETSKADIRYWSTLANNYQMGGVRLKNGDYRVEIILPNDNNRKIFEKNIGIKSNETTFLDLNF